MRLINDFVLRLVFQIVVAQTGPRDLGRIPRTRLDLSGQRGLQVV